MLKKSVAAVFMLVFMLATNISSAAPQQPLNLDQLLQQLQQGKFAQSQENQQREARFKTEAAAQELLLREAMAEREQLEHLSEGLERQFEANESELASLTDALTQRMGSLRELVVVLQQVSSDTASKLQSSLISAEYPARLEPLVQLAEKMGRSSTLASMAEIEIGRASCRERV